MYDIFCLDVALIFSATPAFTPSSFTWQRNGNSQPNVNQSPKLNLANVDIQDGGHYVCTVVNGLGAITREYVIAVVGKVTQSSVL